MKQHLFEDLIPAMAHCLWFYKLNHFRPYFNISNVCFSVRRGFPVVKYAKIFNILYHLSITIQLRCTFFYHAEHVYFTDLRKECQWLLVICWKNNGRT